MPSPQENTHLNARVRVKICGITRPEDALDAARHGADAIGLVFYRKSPRAVTVAQARRIAEAMPPFVAKVGLFVDPEESLVHEVLSQVPLDLLQFHGDETPQACARYGRPFIKAIQMREDVQLARVAEQYHMAAGLLLDTYVDGVQGGTGQAFDWKRVPRRLAKPVILAGGLTPDNVAKAISLARPYAVDVSGGVEQSKGIKDPEKMAAFMRGVCNVSFP